jgi:ArsR family transcriptional regulator
MAADLKAVASTYKALADPTRLRILALLVEGEVCVCDIHDTLRLPQPTASRHLAYLRRTGLVVTRRGCITASPMSIRL